MARLSRTPETAVSSANGQAARLEQTAGAPAGEAEAGNRIRVLEDLLEIQNLHWRHHEPNY